VRELERSVHCGRRSNGGGDWRPEEENGGRRRDGAGLTGRLLAWSYDPEEGRRRGIRPGRRRPERRMSRTEVRLHGAACRFLRCQGRRRDIEALGVPGLVRGDLQRRRDEGGGGVLTETSTGERGRATASDHPRG
jgi:hypothetical protein